MTLYVITGKRTKKLVQYNRNLYNKFTECKLTA